MHKYFKSKNLFITGKLFTPIEVKLLKENFSKVFRESNEQKTQAGVELEEIWKQSAIEYTKKSITVDAFFNAIIFVLNCMNLNSKKLHIIQNVALNFFELFLSVDFLNDFESEVRCDCRTSCSYDVFVYNNAVGLIICRSHFFFEARI